MVFLQILIIFFKIYKNEKKSLLREKKIEETTTKKHPLLSIKCLYVMDFYTILRIINLKNVIIYAGEEHTRNIENILKE